MSKPPSEPKHGEKPRPARARPAGTKDEAAAGTTGDAPEASSAAAPPSPQLPQDQPTAAEVAPPPTSAPATTGPQAPRPLSQLRAISDELAHSFPMPIEETGLVLMDVDPHRVHAYWNVTQSDLVTARERTGAGGPPPPLVLRFHDVTPAEANHPQRHAPFDIEVQGLQSNTYVDLWSDGKAYLAELGLRAADGSLEPLARSQRMQMPRAGEAGAHAPPQDANAAGQEPATAEARTRARVLDPTLVSLGDEELVPVFPNVDEEELGELPAGMTRGLQGLPPEDTQATIEPLHLPAAVYGAEPVEAGSARAGPKTEAVGAVASEPSAPESIVSFSSSSLGQRETDLELNAEIHLYGRARPGARLTLYGRPVPLRPDGSFSVHRPLPSGAIVVPLLLTEGDYSVEEPGES